MGNKIAKTMQASASEYYLQDLPSSYNLVFKEVLGRGRFLKSILCKHDEGLVFVKVYFKRGDTVDLRGYERMLGDIRERLKYIQHSHVWPFQCWFETEKAGYMLRQHFFSNLYDRLSTRPFLSIIEKKWLAFQLLHALQQSHDKGVCHGDIKCENVLVTSWNWIYLADYASFKPTYIPDDDPSDFSFYFDTGERRRCYLAPERFYESGGPEDLLSRDAKLHPSMDIFSLGCVLAELFLEGQPLFELSQLLAYRRGQYDPKPLLDKIADVGIRNMILHMIQLDPEARLSCDSYLQSFASEAFPKYFSSLFHGFFSCLMASDVDTRVLAIQSAFIAILKHMRAEYSEEGHTNKTARAIVKPNELLSAVSEENNAVFTRSDSMKKIFRDTGKSGDGSSTHLNTELINIISHLQKELDGKRFSRGNRRSEETSGKYLNEKAYGVSNDQNAQTALPNEACVGKEDSDDEECLVNEMKKAIDDNIPQVANNGDTSCYNGMVLIASLLCACVRSVTVTRLRRRAITLLLLSSRYIDDDDRMQRVLPYIVAMVSDSSAIVRCAALQALCDVLALVNEFTPSEAKIFPEYILPMLSRLPNDSEESVRICYARSISKLAKIAIRFMEYSQSLNEMNNFEKSIVSDTVSNSRHAPSQMSEGKTSESKFKNTDPAELVNLRQTVAHAIQDLVMGPKQTPNIRRALLTSIKELCVFFGEKQCNDFLLPNLPAFLNDRDQQLHAEFFKQIVHVCCFVGQISVEEYVFPYIEQALTVDIEEVVVNALRCLAFLASKKLLRKKILLDTVQIAAPLLCHPGFWVRKSAIRFITSSGNSLHQVDAYVYLSNMLHPFLRREPTSFSSATDLEVCLKSPMSRKHFNEVIDKFLTSQNSTISENCSSESRCQEIEANPAGVEASSLSAHVDVAKEGGPCSSLEADLNTTNRLPDKNVDAKIIGTSVQKSSSGASDDSIKMRAMENYFLSMSTTMQMREHRSLENSKRLHSSDVGVHPSSVGENNSDMNRSFGGIPVYTYSASDRKSSHHVLPAVNDELTKEKGHQMGSSSLMNMHSGAKSVASSQPKFFANPRLTGSISLTKSGSKAVKDVSGKDGLSKNSRATMIKDVSWSDFNASINTANALLKVPDASWQPRGVLVVNLQEHRSAVNDVTVSSDNGYFVTASDDGTVKIWNSRRLEKDISFRSRLTRTLPNGRALRTVTFDSESSVAVASSSGSLHVFSVNYVPRRGRGTGIYAGLSDIAKKETGEGAVLSLKTLDVNGRQMLLYSTQLNGIHLWDMRAQKNSWTLKANPKEGYVSDIVVGHCQNWILSGSSGGVLTLWDLRFLIPVNTWRYPEDCPINKICLHVPGSSSRASTADGPFVYVAAGSNQIALCNVKNGSFQQIFRSASFETALDNQTGFSSSSSQSSSNSGVKFNSERNGHSKFRFEELSNPPGQIPGIRALVPLQGGHVLTGGTDMKIRFWNHTSPDRSYCICGPSVRNMDKELYTVKSLNGVQVVQETYSDPKTLKLMSRGCTDAAKDPSGCHRDCILSMASIQLHQRFLLSSSRDGAVKVWK